MKSLFLILFLTVLHNHAFSQHDHHSIPTHTDVDSTAHSNHTNKSDTTWNRTDHNHPMDSSHHSFMPNAFSRNLPMSRTGSGTSWLPDNSPMFMNIFHKNQWMFMLHYGVFLAYTNQNVLRESKHRGDAQLIVPDWCMAMALRPVGQKGLFMVRTMISLDPIFMGGFGYPLLFQTGETWRDKPLVDRQHPHELISELSVGYSHAFTKNADMFIYIGMPGEPALGPPAFMHRPSAMNIPASPLGHHWQDATHIIYGVATLGIRYRNVKLEGSSFTGSEPNENRYGFDKPKFNSYSFRLSVNPTKSLALQTSYGYLVSPEVQESGVNVERFTASVLHSLPLNSGSIISSSFVWGMNKALESEHEHHFSNSFLIESNLITKRCSFFTRIESIEKSFHELAIEDVDDKDENNLINSFSLGASRFLLKGKAVWIDLGLMGTYYIIDKKLNIFYGKNPFSADFFLRLIPARMQMK